MSPTNTELEAYLKVNPGKFEMNPMIAFRQIYMIAEQRGDSCIRTRPLFSRFCAAALDRISLHS